MCILARFKALFQSEADKAAEDLPDPAVALDRSLARLEDNRRELRRSLVAVSAARQQLEAQQARRAAELAQYEEQARAAIAAGEDDLAWTALQRKEEAAGRRAELAAGLANLEQQENNLKQSQATLEHKIEALRSKKHELTSLYSATEAQLRVQEALAGISEDLADVGATIRRAEARTLELQTRAEAIEELVDEGALPDALAPDRDYVERQLDRLRRHQAVEEELARLKAEAQRE